MVQQKQEEQLLDVLQAKPFSALTTEEREMLKKLTVKKT
jgi:hypothetical protein